MKKICMVTTSRIDIDSRIQNEAESLANRYDVTILSRQYNVPITLEKTTYKIKRISYLKLWSYRVNVILSIGSLFIAALKEKPDIYHAHDLDGLLATFVAAWIKRKPLIYDSHELWSENARNSQLRGIGWIMPILENFLIRFISGGIATSQSTVNELEKKYHRNFILIRNLPKLTNQIRSELNLHKMFPNKTIIVHAGQIGPSRGIKQMILTLKHLHLDLILVFLGGKSDPLINKIIKDQKLTNRVDFIKEVPPNQLVSVLKTADLGIVMTEGLSKSKLFSLPNKLFQYIAAEIPVIASDIPEHRRIIKTEKIGLLTKISPTQIAKNIIKILKPNNQKIYRQNLKGLAKRKYNWGAESKKLLNYYKISFKN